ncbi:MAG: ExbD/TolR family protein [Verrucomicrobiales bacterium]
MAGGGGTIESGEPEFQVAPMVDVLLTILIFFMTITSMEVLQIDQDIVLPVAPDAKKAEKDRGEVILNVRWNPETKKCIYSIGQTPYANLDDMVEPLSKAVEGAKRSIKTGGNPHVRMVIRAARDTPAFEVLRVMEAGAEAGIADIAFSAASKE